MVTGCISTVPVLPFCPSIKEFRAYRPPEATRVFAEDGSRIADLSHERRTVVDMKQVPEVVSNGFIAVEDRRFWRHNGVDLLGIGRAVFSNMLSGSLGQGFSTITMQLARSVFTEELPRSQKMRRKLCEIQLAGQIERLLTKKEILQSYMNQVYMGDGRYGVEEAAQGYFGKPVSELSLGEAALIVGLVKNPEGYNPRKQLKRAIDRRNTVLDILAREKVAPKAEIAKAKAAPIALAKIENVGNTAPYFIAAVRSELQVQFGADADTRGLRVHTALDPVLQKAAEKALLAQIQRIEAGKYGRFKHPVAPKGKLEPANGGGSPYLQGMVFALDAETGNVRALVGGRDFTHSSYDRALVARRQPGSAFKPIVYAAALEAGMTLGTGISTAPVSLESVGSPVWQPDDLVDPYEGTISVRRALALSSNFAAIRVGQFAGTQSVISMARRLGLTTPIPPYPAIFLGAAEVSPAEFVAAFATLGNGGYRVRPRFIQRVEDSQGTVLWEAESSRQQALDPGIAFLTLNLMESVVDFGTGNAVRRAGFWLPAAGKTGTTNEAKDVWFVGMTPDMVAGVWLGFDQPTTIMPKASGGQLAAPVWAEAMKVAYADKPKPTDWHAPNNVIAVEIDYETGQLASEYCPYEQIRTEYFIVGTEPTEYCMLQSGWGSQGLMGRIVKGIRRIL
jgi:penicillin-binding protein 1A